MIRRDGDVLELSIALGRSRAAGGGRWRGEAEIYLLSQSRLRRTTHSLLDDLGSFPLASSSCDSGFRLSREGGHSGSSQQDLQTPFPEGLSSKQKEQ